jgi:cell division protein FtsB
MQKPLEIKEKVKSFGSKLKGKNISVKFLLFDLALLIIIVTLTSNIYRAYNDGVRNLGRLKIEEEKLIKLQEENAKLNEEENYYKSIEFRKAYARDSLNLSKEGETLYLVIRDENEEEAVEEDLLFDPNTVNKSKQWKLLILGR